MRKYVLDSNCYIDAAAEPVPLDALQRFTLTEPTSRTSTACIAGEVLRGRKKPKNCPAFATTCTPEHPLGAPMVSAEGVCAAYYQFRRLT